MDIVKVRKGGKDKIPKLGKWRGDRSGNGKSFQMKRRQKSLIKAMKCYLSSKMKLGSNQPGKYVRVNDDVNDGIDYVPDVNERGADEEEIYDEDAIYRLQHGGFIDEKADKVVDIPIKFWRREGDTDDYSIVEGELELPSDIDEDILEGDDEESDEEEHEAAVVQMQFDQWKWGERHELKTKALLKKAKTVVKSDSLQEEMKIIPGKKVTGLMQPFRKSGKKRMKKRRLVQDPRCNNNPKEVIVKQIEKQKTVKKKRALKKMKKAHKKAQKSLANAEMMDDAKAGQSDNSILQKDGDMAQEEKEKLIE